MLFCSIIGFVAISAILPWNWFCHNLRIVVWRSIEPVISSFGYRLFKCLLSCLSHGKYSIICGNKIFPLQKVIFIEWSSPWSHTYLRYWLQCHVPSHPCSSRESQICPTTSRPPGWAAKVSLVRGETLLCALRPRLLQVYLPGMKPNQLPSTLGFCCTALSLCSFAKYEFKSRCSNIGNCCENEMT